MCYYIIVVKVKLFKEVVIMKNTTKEIIDTIATLEDFPSQRNADFSAVTMRRMIEAILPLIEADATADEIAYAMACACPKFGG